MNEPPEPRPQQAANGLRLLVLIPVLIAVGGVLMLATKLSFRFNQIEEPPAQDYPPNPNPRAGASGQPILPAAARPKDRRPAPFKTDVISPSPAPAAPKATAATTEPLAEIPPVLARTVVPPSPQTFSGTVRATQDLPANGIVGRVILKGTPPPEQQIPVDPTCGKLNARVMTRFYAVGTNAGLANVFVVIKELPPGRWILPETPVEIRQRGCEYLPYINAAMAGQVIRVFNDDPTLHNVHPTPTADGNQESNRAQLPGGAPLDFRFKEPESFLRFKCDVHPWMFAYVSVVAHPFFAVSAADGSFALPEPPPGRYKVQFNHRKAGTQEVEVNVSAGKRLVVNVAYNADRPGKGDVSVTEE